MNEDMILGAFLALIRAAEDATADLSLFHRFVKANDRTKKQQQVQAYLDTRRTTRRNCRRKE